MRLAQDARQLLGGLHPANSAAFARIVVAAMQRAAAVGEAFLEDSLSGLAEKDPGRFQQLQQRLTVRPGSAHAKCPLPAGAEPSAVMPWQRRCRERPAAA